MSEADVDVIRDFRRGATRLHVLHHASEQEVSGAWLAAELAEHDYRISPGTLYPLLHDLEAAGLLVSTERVEDGHVTHGYLATSEGRTTLSDAREALSELAAELLPAGDARPVTNSATPAGHRRSTAADRTGKITDDFDQPIDQLRADVRRIGDPRTQARYETAAEVPAGLRQLLAEAR